MDLTPYVDSLRQELAAAADAVGEDAAALAGRLSRSLESASRLVLLKVLSDAMAEITSELAPGSVEVRLYGLDPGFIVTPPPYEPFEERPGRGAAADGGTAPPVSLPPVPDEEENGAARTSLRLPVHLKQRAGQAAKREGISLNAWLVRAVSSALGPAAAEDRRADEPGTRAGQGRKSITGWVG